MFGGGFYQVHYRNYSENEKWVFANKFQQSFIRYAELQQTLSTNNKYWLKLTLNTFGQTAHHEKLYVSCALCLRAGASKENF